MSHYRTELSGAAWTPCGCSTASQLRYKSCKFIKLVPFVQCRLLVVMCAMHRRVTLAVYVYVINLVYTVSVNQRKYSLF
jgi:hypothetical protein